MSRSREATQVIHMPLWGLCGAEKWQLVLLDRRGNFFNSLKSKVHASW